MGAFGLPEALPTPVSEQSTPQVFKILTVPVETATHNLEFPGEAVDLDLVDARGQEHGARGGKPALPGQTRGFSGQSGSPGQGDSLPVR